MRRFFISAILFVLPLLAAGSQDAVRVQNVETEYTLRTGLDPTLDNLLASIQPKPPGQLRSGELVTALKLIGLTAGGDSRAKDAVLHCMRLTASWSTKVACAKALMAMGAPEGKSSAEALLADSQFDLQGKVSLALALLDHGILSGYSVLGSALNADSLRVRMAGFALLEQFRTHEGKIWSEKGERIELAKFPPDVLNYTSTKETLFQRYGYTKYGYPGKTLEVPPINGERGFIVDYSAWKVSIAQNGESIKVTLSLDPSQYNAVAEFPLEISLRGKASNGVEQAKVDQGLTVPGILEIPMVYTKPDNQTVLVEFQIPRSERTQYLLQVVAELEPGWKAISNISLPM